jgi:CMP-N-acetylneuraminic acid synthetase
MNIKRENNLAIIPARGGSKGVPGKNIRLLAGKPLIAYVIEEALRAKTVDRIIVSTDDDKIAEVAKQYRAEIIRRPSELATDSSSSESAILHALEHLEKTEKYNPDLITFLQCTSPLTIAEDIDGLVETFKNEKADSALTVAPFHYFLWKKDERGNALGINHDKNRRLLRQERDSQYLETGAAYVMSAGEFRKAKHRFFGKTSMYVVSAERCLEIDELKDFQIAEAVLKERRGHA